MPAQKMKLLRSKSPLPLVLALMIGLRYLAFAYFRAKQTNALDDSSFANSRAGARALARSARPQLKEPTRQLEGLAQEEITCSWRLEQAPLFHDQTCSYSVHRHDSTTVITSAIRGPVVQAQWLIL